MTNQFCLKWNNYQLSLTTAFKHILEDEEFVDVTLSAEKSNLKAHKVVLSACSSYFRNLLKGISPWQHPVLVLRDVPFLDLQSILEFVYLGEVNVEQERLESFLKTAEILQIKGLTDGLRDPGGEKTRYFSEPQKLPPRVKFELTESLKRSRLSEEVVQPPLLTPTSLVPPTSLLPASGAVLATSSLLTPSPEKRLKTQMAPLHNVHMDMDQDGDTMVIDELKGGSSEDGEDDEVEEVTLAGHGRTSSVDGSAVDDGECSDGGGEYIEVAGDPVTTSVPGDIVGQFSTLGGDSKEELGPLHKRCPVCHMIMLKKNLSRHIRDQHTQERPRSTCPVCKKTYKTQDWLKDHIRRGHGYTKEATDELMAKVKLESGDLNGSETSMSPIQVV